MIPIRDDHPSGSVPIVTWLLIISNTLVLVYMLFLPDAQLEAFLNSYAMVPAEIVAHHHLQTLFTSMFLHAGFGHLIGNMLFLYIFGDNLENEFGGFKYLGLYLIGGLGASLLQIIVDPTSTIPNLGASGAIAGLMGGYLILFPDNRIDVLFTLGPIWTPADVPAHFMIVYWFVAQLFYGVGSIGGASSGGVAYFAHIGGFTTGCLLCYMYKKSTASG